MFNWIKDFRKSIESIGCDIAYLNGLLDSFKKKHIDKLEEFGLKEPIMDTEERKNYVSEVSVVFEKVLKPKIEKLIYQQKEYIALKGLKDEYDFDRGTMNGILTVFEEFEKDHLEHLDNTKPKEEFDKHKMFDELGIGDTK